MDVDVLPTYILVMKILGCISLVIGSLTLYLIFYHSGKIGKQYKVALILHQCL